MDSTLLSIILTAVGTAAGWVFGRMKRKADNTDALASSLDTQSETVSHFVQVNESLAAKYTAVFEENVTLREKVTEQEAKIRDLSERQQELVKEVEAMRTQLRMLLKELNDYKMKG